MPKPRNEIITPEQKAIKAKEELAKDKHKKESAEQQKRAKLNKEVEATRFKLSVAVTDIPPIDTFKEEEALRNWEMEKGRSLEAIQNSITYQENQIEQMREAFERKVKTIQDRMEMSKRTLADKETYFIKMVFQAKQRLYLAQNPPESTKVRKLRAKLHLLEDEISKSMKREQSIVQAFKDEEGAKVEKKEDRAVLQAKAKTEAEEELSKE